MNTNRSSPLHPLISVIVPAYNAEETLGRCVNSIESQSYPNLEIILIDDGSTDGTKTMIQDLAQKDRRIRPVFQKNGGVSSARLAGIANAEGEYIGFVDVDDEIEQEMYEKLLHNSLNWNADISHCGFQMCFPDGRVRFFGDSGEIVVQNHEEALRDLLRGEIEPGLCNKLYRKHIVQTVVKERKIDLTIHNNEDLLMNYFFFQAAALTVYEGFCPYRYIVRQQSASRKTPDEHVLFDPVLVRKIILNDCSPGLRVYAEQMLLRSCVYPFCGMIWKRSYSLERKRFREILREHRDCIRKLPLKTRLLAYLMDRAPWTLWVAYPIYEALFQTKQYE